MVAVLVSAGLDAGLLLVVAGWFACWLCWLLSRLEGGARLTLVVVVFALV